LRQKLRENHIATKICEGGTYRKLRELLHDRAERRVDPQQHIHLGGQVFEIMSSGFERKSGGQQLKINVAPAA
jgi:hypothetical protein